MRQAVPHIRPRDLPSEEHLSPITRWLYFDQLLDRPAALRRWNLIALPLALSVLLIALFAHDSAPLVASPAEQQAASPPPNLPYSASHSAGVTATLLLPGGFVAVGESVLPTTQNGQQPAIAIQPNAVEPWVALTQNNRVLVSKYMSATDSWQQQAGILNRISANVAREPSLTFAGAGLETPWAAWQEDMDGVTVINASSFNGTAWNLTPILNRDPAQTARQPVIVAGATVTGAIPLPWTAWTEDDGSGVSQLVVSRAQIDNRLQGGFGWLPVGSTLNLAPTRTAIAPDLAFAGPSNTVPWVVWSETGADRAERIFAKRWNGTTWAAVGRQEGCNDEIGCALNTNALTDAGAVQIAAGTLPNEVVPAPWLVYQEVGALGNQEIRVMRLDAGNPAEASDDRFIPVGGAVNAQCLGNAGVSAAVANNVDVRTSGLRDSADAQNAAAISGGNATDPDIYFVGHVPHVAWVETHGALTTLYVCHLADARAGLERWDLDTVDGVNRTAAAAALPALVANGTTPYIAWQETQTNTTVYVARRSPAGPAWGTNFPALLTDIAGGTALAADALAAAASNQPDARSVSVPLLTAAYHVDGIDALEEVQLQLWPRTVATATVPVLFARYAISDNLIYVQDPERPGNFYPPVTPGTNVSNINTPFVTVEPSKIKVTDHGAPSAALDITWSLIFEDATFFKEYVQAINVVYNDGATSGRETGFFQVGTVYVGSRVYLPVVLGE